MMAKNKKNSWTPLKIVGFAFLFGIAFWILDSIYHYFTFSAHLRRMIVQKPESLLDPMLFHIEPHQLFVRSIFLIFSLIAGIVLAFFWIRQKNIEKKIKESEEHYRILTERANDGIGLIYNGNFVYTNPRISEISGYSSDELNGSPFIQFVAPSEVHRLKEMYKKRVAYETATSVYETLVINKSGNEVPVEINAGLINWKDKQVDLIFIRDITFRKAAQKALQESEEKYRTLTNNINIAIYRNSIELKGSFIEVNQAFVKMFGFESREEIIDLKAIDFYADPEKKEIFNEELFRNNAIQDKELLLKRKDGSVFVGKISARLVRDHEGNPKYYDGLIEDITAQKEYERKLTETNEELLNLKQTLEQKVEDAIKEIREKDHMLIKQSRQATMGEMIGNIAHQWRQPLTAIAVLVQGIEEAFKYDELTEEYLEKTIQTTMDQLKYMSRTIDDFRNFFRPNKTKEEFSLNKIINETVKFVKSSFHNNQIELELDLADECRIEGFPNEYMQVVLNILNNAKDAIKKSTVEKPIVRVTLLKQNEKSVLSIFDNADTIPEEILDKIFDPYFTTKSEQQGTGLGLYMAKNIIEKNMGGRLLVRNVNDGVIFEIIV